MRIRPTPPPAPTGALADALDRMRGLAGSPLATVPGAAMMVLDAELRVRMMIGPVWAELGVDVDAVVGRPLRETAPPDTYERVAGEYAAVLEGESRAFSLPLSGDRSHWLTAMPIRAGDDGPVEGVLAVSWDQTDARRAEAQYRLLADNATDIVTRHDTAGTYLYVSPSIEAFLGYTPEELLGRTSLELIHPDDVDLVVASRAGASHESPSPTGSSAATAATRGPRPPAAGSGTQAARRRSSAPRAT
jgi:PAS domain-containing protein